MTALLELTIWILLFLQPNKELFIKYRSGPFIKSTFNTDLLRKDYHIADITNNRIMVAVSHSETVCNLYVSDIITEETQSIHFRLSLESIFCYFPNATWKSSLIRWVLLSYNVAKIRQYCR